MPLGHGGANPSVPAQSGATGGKRAPPPAFQGLEGRVWLEAASGFDRRIEVLQVRMRDQTKTRKQALRQTTQRTRSQGWPAHLTPVSR
jgi:hypothetical protein